MHFIVAKIEGRWCRVYVGLCRVCRAVAVFPKRFTTTKKEAVIHILFTKSVITLHTLHNPKYYTCYSSKDRR